MCKNRLIRLNELIHYQIFFNLFSFSWVTWVMIGCITVFTNAALVGQFSCGAPVILNDGYTDAVMTPGSGGIEDWVTAATTCGISDSYFISSDVYLFSYTTILANESLTFDVTSNNTWTAAMAFSTCSGTSFSDCLDDDSNGSSTGNLTLELGGGCSPTLPIGTTVYFAVGQWGGLGDPHDLDFTISFSASMLTLCSGPTVATDDCISAPSIDFTTDYSGSTNCCYTDAEEGQLCGAFSIENNSWIQFTAASSDIDIDYNVTNCSDGNGIQIGIFEGTCNSFTASYACENNVIGSGDFQLSGLTPGETYYIMIDGYAGDLCDFTFTPDGGIVICDNDLCADAIDLACSDSNIVNGLQCATVNDADVDCNIGGTATAGVWYSFIGTGDDIVLSVNNAATDFAAIINIYEGSCGAKSCVTGTSGNGTNEVSFTSVNGTSYFIYISGAFGAIGIYELSIECTTVTPCPGNLTAGGVDVTVEGVAQTSCDTYNLTDGETIVFTLDGSAVLPPPSSNPSNSGSYVGLAIFSCDPVAAGYDMTDPLTYTSATCFEDMDADPQGDGMADDSNSGGASTSGLPIPYWVVPVTLDFRDCNGIACDWDVDDNNNGCVAAGCAMMVTMNEPPPCECTDPVCGGMHWDCSSEAESDYNSGSLAAEYDIVPDYNVTNGETYQLCWDYTTGPSETNVGFVHALGYEFDNSDSIDDCDFTRVYHVYETGCGSEIPSSGSADFTSHGQEYNLSSSTAYSFCVDITIDDADCLSLAANFVYLYNADIVFAECGTCATPCTEDGMGSVPIYDDRSWANGGTANATSCWSPDCDIYGPQSFTNCFDATADANGFLGFANQIGNDGNPSCIDISWELTAVGDCANVIANPVDNANSVGSGFNPEYSGLTPGGDYTLCITYDLLDFLCGFNVSDGDRICVESYGLDCNVMLTDNTSMDGFSCKDDGIPLETTINWTGTFSGAATVGFLVFCDPPVLPMTEAYYNANALDAILETFDVIGIEINNAGNYVDPFNPTQICNDQIYLVPITIDQITPTGFVFDWSCFATEDVVQVELGVTPSPTAMADPVTICAGESTDLTATGGGTYLWDNSLGTNPMVTVSPTTTTTYTVTVTDDSGNCTETADVEVMVNNPGVEPTTECWETATLNTATCMWDVAGTQPTEPSPIECWETNNFDDATCAWVTTGTQPTEPSPIECWETNNFDDATCAWVTTGTQPTEPSPIECWETNNFDDATCAWVTTGTQPTEPSPIECWETNNFDDATCAWVTTGTQPTEPSPIECWETNNFDDATCAWVTTGTQPTEPSPIECWETNNFDDATCAWVTTGTQPTEPSPIECWETNNFDDATCAWVTTGTQPTEPSPIECWETNNFDDATCAWVTTGTQPTEPSPIECWETNNFDDATCAWVTTGTQPTEPSPIECWETNNFDDATCAWVTTGTQPTEPSPIECWETNNFDDATCAWVTTGTQPTEPSPIECWETNNFDDATCAWVTTGTQPTEPSPIECWETNNFDDATCAWVTTGTQPTEPSPIECWETNNFDDATCAWVTTGTQPTEPSPIECWETNNFDDATCAWVTTGTQPTEPSPIECWETNNFDDATCAWVTTGTQPTEPSPIECWETNNFDDATCAWVTTGTQPTEPSPIECWETNNFDDATCAWVTTGTQPTEPSPIECWETNNFDDATCAWVTTGTQPTEPSPIECWETNNFDDATCAWVTTGTQPTEPSPIECWETNNFDDATCAWVTTGTQPTEPSPIECWETNNFDDATCAWVTTGTQPTEPSPIECWETNNFDDATCAWVTTGTQPTEPSPIECWETNNFDDATCAWVTTGIQPTEPSPIECWETNNFDDATCAWVTTGTQPAEPSPIECWETNNFDDATCAWVTTGTQPTEPSPIECWETNNFDDATCAWVTTGTQPTEPSPIECWETNNFDDATCAWVTTGTQPTEPSPIECWETNNFDDATCAWVTTGTQPAEPSPIECWETNNFDDATCAWVTTGTQPTEPSPIECWETNNFDDATCAWVTTGTQPTEPSPIECWETNNFDDATCAWVTTGTQPTEPFPIECWETNNFDDATCAWVTTGTQPTEPSPIECWETNNFDDATCAWVTTGTQPTEPSPIECWETNNFDDATCAWVTTGTQTAAPTAVSPADICTGDAAPDLTATGGGGTIIWYDSDPTVGSPTSIGMGSPFTPTLNTSTATVVTYWVVEDSGGCESLASEVMITINDCGCMNPAFVDVDADFTICENEVANLTAVLSGSASSVTWTTSGDGSFDDASSLTPVYTLGTTDISSGSVTLTSTTDDPDGAGPCSENSDGVTVTITQETAATFAVIADQCEGGTNPLPTTSQEGYTGTWTPAFDPDNTMTYTFTVNGGQCASDGMATVMITQETAATFAAIADQCEGGTNPLPTTSQEGFTGTWTPAFDPDNTMTYTFTVNGGQCASDGMATVTITQETAATFAAIADQCEGGTNPLPTMSQEGIMGTWSPAFDPDVTTTYTFTVNGGQCASDGMATVTITPTVTPTFTLTDTYCIGDAGEALPMTSDNGINGTWSPSMIATASAGMTTYTFTPTPGGCEEEFTIEITVNDCGCMDPALVSVDADFTICEDEVANLTAVLSGSASSVTWTTSGDGSFDDASSLTPAYTLGTTDISSGSVTLTATTDDPDGAGPCSENSDGVIITITQATLATFAAIADQCEGGTNPLPTTSQEGFTGTWSPAFNPDVTTTYTFTVNGGQCASDGMATVTITPTVTPTFTLTDTYCIGDAGDALPMTSDNGINGTWSPSMIATASAGMTTYTFTPTPGGCEEDFTIEITVNDCGCMDPALVSVDADFTICDNEVANLTAVLSGSASSVIWTTSGDGSFDDASSLTPVYTIGTTDISSGSVTLTATTDDPDGAGPCSENSDGVTVTITQETAATFAAIADQCEGGTNPLPTTSQEGFTGTWSPAFDPDVTTTYTFTVDGGQCASDGMATVTITQETAATFAAIADQCEGGTNPLPTTSQEGFTGTWTPAFDPDVTTTYTFTVDGGQCASDGMATVTITPTVTPTFTLTDTYCIGDAGEALPTTSDNGINGTWSPSMISTASAGMTTYTFTPTPGGCEEEFTIEITVNDCACMDPALVSVDADFTICEDELANLTAVLSGSASSVTWTTSGDGSFDDASSLTPAYTLGTTDISSGTVTLTATTDDPDGAGPCSENSDGVIITITQATLATFAAIADQCEGGTNPLPTMSQEGIMGTWSPAFDPDNTTTYTFTVNGGQCASDGMATVTITPTVTPTFTLTDTYCIGDAGEALPTTSDNGINGTWSPSMISTASAGMTTYTFTPTPGGCEEEFTIEITVNDCACMDPALVSVDADFTICEDELANLTAVLSGSASSVTWTTSGDGSFDDASSLTPAYTLGTTDISSGTVTLTATTDDPDGAGPCSENSDGVIITITQATPATFTAIADQCEGGTNPLPTMSQEGIMGTWSPAFDPDVTTTYTFTVNGGQCASDGMATVTITPTVTPTFTLTDTYCIGDAGEALPMTSDNGINGTWSPSMIATASAGMTTYTFTPTPGGCEEEFTIEITVNDCGCMDPALVSVDADFTICEDEVANLTAVLSGSASTVTWTTSGDGSFDDASSLTPAYTLGTTDISSGTVTLTATTDDPDGAGPCSENSDGVIITITQATLATFAAIADQCEGGTNPLPTMSQEGIMGTWSPAFDPDVTTTYTFTVNGGQCASDGMATVTITPTVTPTFTLTDTYCIGDAGDALPMTSDNGINGTWSPSMISTASAGMTTYTFTPTPGGCEEDFTIEITVNDCACMDPALVSVDADFTICEDEVANLTAVLSGSASTVTWTTSGDGSFDDASSLTPAYTLGTTDISSGTVTLTATTDDPDGAGPCSENSDGVIITITQATLATFAAIADQCEGGTNPLPTMSQEGIMGTWSPAFDPDVTTTYTFTVNGGQCASDGMATVTITPTVTPTFTLTDTYCIGDAGEALPMTSDNGINGTWSPSMISTASAGMTTYTFTPTPGGCEEDFTIEITVNDCACMDPALVSVDADFTICEDEVANLTAVLSGSASTVTWTTSGDGSFDDASSLTPAYTLGTTDISSGTVTLTATTDDPDGAGPCSENSDGVIITITQATPATFTAIADQCEGGTNPLPTMSQEGIMGTWSPAFDPDVTTTYTFTVNGGQCASDGMATVTITPTVTPTFTLTDTYCIGDAGEALPMTSDNGINGTWSPSMISTASAGMTTYTFTPTPGGCEEDFTIEITVNDCACMDPALVSVDADFTICEDEVANLTAVLSGSASTVTWTTSGDGSFDDASSLTPAYTLGTTDISSGTVTLTATTDDPDGAGPCSENSDGVIITITQATPATFTAIADQCEGGTNPLPTMSQEGIMGTWSPAFDPDVTTTYTFTVNGGQCASDGMATVTITPTVTPTFTLTDTYCIGDAGDALPMTSDNGINGTWSPSMIATASAGMTTYTFTPTPGGCEEDFTIEITVNDCACMDPALVSVDADFTICEDELANLTAVLSGSASSVTWTTSGDGSFDDASSLTPAYSLGTTDISSGTVTLTAMTDDPDGAGPCSENSDGVIITITQATLATFAAIADQCEGGTNPLPTMSQEGIMGTWSPAFDPDVTTTYTFTVNGGQCASDGMATVTITPTVTPTFTLTDTYCIGDAGDALPTTSDNGINGTWSPSMISTASAGMTTYTFTPTPGGCEEDFTIEITVNDCACMDPALVSVDADFTICEDELANLTAVLSGSASSVTWTTSGDGSFDDASSLTPVYTIGTTDISSGTVTLTATTDDPDGAGPCSENSDGVIITITQATLATFAAIADQCEGATNPLPTMSQEGIMGTWSPAFDPDVTTTYTFTVNGGQCASDGMATVTINDCESCDFAITLSSPAICNDNDTLDDSTDDTFTFGITVSGSNTGLDWTADDAISTIGLYDTEVVFGPYLVANGDVDLLIVDNVDPLCFDNIRVVAPISCSGDCPEYSLELNVVSHIDGSSEFDLSVITDIVPVEFIWNSPELLSCTDCLDPTVTTSQENTLVSLTLVDDRGCDVMASTLLMDPFDIYIPDAFTPDGDGTNDLFQIYSTGGRIQQISEMRIYNRWGDQVYEVNGVDPNLNMWWDGFYRGERVPVGVYVYYVNLVLNNGNSIERSGDITVLK